MEVTNKVRIFAGINLKQSIMDWLHIVAVIALVIIGVVMYVNKRKTMMVAWLTIATAAWGNDGVLYVSGPRGRTRQAPQRGRRSKTL